MLAQPTVRLVASQAAHSVRSALLISFAQTHRLRRHVATHTTTYTTPVRCHNSKSGKQDKHADEHERGRQGAIDHVFQFSSASHTVSFNLRIKQHNRSSVELDSVQDNAIVINVPQNSSEADIVRKITDIFKVDKSNVKLHGGESEKQVAVTVPKNYDKDKVADLIAQAFVTPGRFL